MHSTKYSSHETREPMVIDIENKQLTEVASSICGKHLTPYRSWIIYIKIN